MMKQSIIKKGNVFNIEVPSPAVQRGIVRIKVLSSCISPGTENYLVQESSKSLIKKSIEQPKKIAKTLDLIKSKGIAHTKTLLKEKSEAVLATGYSLSGIIVEIGVDCAGFQVGDEVTASGAGYASHAEYVVVPKNLVCKKPRSLSFEDASTVTLGAIALQGVRRADLKLGEIALVFGTGVLGLLTIQLLVQSGVRVIAADIDQKRLSFAKKSGAEECLLATDPTFLDKVEMISGGYGVDTVLMTANTSSQEPISQSFKCCKKKGKVVLVGVCGLNINRNDLYQKELDLYVSTSYGPGRYDSSYEEDGHDYPYAYVRWTEKRNMEEYLRLLERGSISVSHIFPKTMPFDQITEAFDLLNSSDQDKPFVIILKYPNKEKEAPQNIIMSKQKKSIEKDIIKVGLIGAGQFAKSMHIPNLKKLGKKFQLHGVTSHKPLNAKKVSEQYNIPLCSTNPLEIINHEDIDLVMICTPHHNHASLTLDALRVGKHVFVEKPLAVTSEQLNDIKSFYTTGDKEKPLLTVGFNRRFSPYVEEIKHHTKDSINPLNMIYRMNAGYQKPDHWVHKHGGRIIGECCHIIDTMTSLTNSKIVSYSVNIMSPKTSYYSSDDNKIITLTYEDGSIGSIHYFSTGNPTLSKEYMEIHFDGKSIVMDDYRDIKGYGCSIKNIKNRVSNKGHFDMLQRLYSALTKQQEDWPIPLWDLLQTSEIVLVGDK